MRFFLRFIDIVFVTFGEFLFNTKTVVPFGLKHPSVNEKKIKLTVSFFSFSVSSLWFTHSLPVHSKFIDKYPNKYTCTTIALLIRWHEMFFRAKSTKKGNLESEQC